ncbi:hypothetical protein [Cupriavidus sp. CuC1]|uniref:hypothetical protein n=1 Tax=Cupriavidus sp. CuC1 TaxID=3373131 RepID=UPI0037D00F87
METNYGKDQILADGLPCVVGLPVSADDKMHVEASTADELENSLVEEGGFSPEAAKEIARQAREPGA